MMFDIQIRGKMFMAVTVAINLLDVNESWLVDVLNSDLEKVTVAINITKII